MSKFQAALLSAGLCNRVISAIPLHDGLSDCWRVDTDSGPYCIKWNPEFALSVMEGQRASLEALANTGAVRVPRPFLAGELEGRGCFLVMEWLELLPLSNDKLPLLARQLGQHYETTSGEFGFSCPTFLGIWPQNNEWNPSWAHFFLEQRLMPLRQLALRRLPAWEELFQVAWPVWEMELRNASTPSLLHGDLSFANVAQTPDGEPVLLDPASYYGDYQMDLALYPQLQPYFKCDADRIRLYRLYHRLQQHLVYGAAEEGFIESELKYWAPRAMV